MSQRKGDVLWIATALHGTVVVGSMQSSSYTVGAWDLTGLPSADSDRTSLCSSSFTSTSSTYPYNIRYCGTYVYTCERKLVFIVLRSCAFVRFWAFQIDVLGGFAKLGVRLFHNNVIYRHTQSLDDSNTQALHLVFHLSLRMTISICQHGTSMRVWSIVQPSEDLLGVKNGSPRPGWVQMPKFEDLEFVNSAGKINPVADSHPFYMERILMDVLKTVKFWPLVSLKFTKAQLPHIIQQDIWVAHFVIRCASWKAGHVYLGDHPR